MMSCLHPAETVIVWRCQDCGGVDAPQPCIDVCIWGPADWVDAASYESQRSRAAVDREVEQSLAGLLRRFAFATPRDGQWERSWRAFQSQARLALRRGNHAALRTRRPSGRLKPMDDAALLAPGIRAPSRRAELPRGRSADPGERNARAAGRLLFGRGHRLADWMCRRTCRSSHWKPGSSAAGTGRRRGRRSHRGYGCRRSRADTAPDGHCDAQGRRPRRA